MREIIETYALVFNPAVCSGGFEMSKQAQGPIDPFPLAKNELKACKLIDFDSINIVPGIVNDTWILVVSGKTPTQSMKVSLMPLVYVRQPEYWEIQVVGCVSGITLPAQGTFTEWLPLDNCRGTKGIEVVGATKREKREVPPGR
jgi:hypothetical protein